MNQPATNPKESPLSFALPKGRLQEKAQDLFSYVGIDFSFKNRKLIARSDEPLMDFFLVKNSDLPTYVNYGIAGLGICGSDVIYESGYDFFKLHTFRFGGTAMCLAGLKGHHRFGKEAALKVATKFTRFTAQHYARQGKPVEIIKLNGSVELSPVLGLTPYIVDLVETGNTLTANNLEIIGKLEDITVHLIANPAYYKLHYQRINALVDTIKEGEEAWLSKKRQ